MKSTPKVLRPSEAIKLIHSGDRILFSCHCGEPLTLLDALARDEGKLENVHLISGLLFGTFPFISKSSLRFMTWHSVPSLAKLIAAGKVDYLPLRYSQTVATFLPDGPLPVDAIFIRVSPPDPKGYCSVGLSPSFSLPLSLSARKVIAETSDDIPRSPGNSFIHQSQITCFVESTFPPTEYRTNGVTQEEERVASLVTELIEDGCTVELGIGTIPSRVTKNLTSRKDLSIHSGMVSDELVDLVESGAVPVGRGRAKNRIVVGELIGTKRLFSFAHENPIFEMATVDVVYNPLVMARIPNFIAVNSAIEVDLSGQVNSETINGLQVGGVGGAFDFSLGASLSAGGKAIIAMTSSAKEGRVSRIVPHLSPRSKVSIPRHYVDYVVTEHGTAHLAGRNLKQRAEALIGIAHPSFRKELDHAMAKEFSSP